MIDYKNELNPAQYQAAMTLEGPMLVLAGAGSGKTRTVVYRLAHMLEQGIPAHEILLLTFTRKASQEMLQRAGELLGHTVQGIQGGTFHGFAYSVLRHHPPQGYTGSLSIMDGPDAQGALKFCKDSLGVGKGDKSFPKTQTVMGMLSKSRNKEQDIADVLKREAYHLAVYRDDIARIGEAYTTYKREHSLLDYDDLLFELERLLQANPDLLQFYRNRFRYIMVDEYQDTNLVQARLVKLLAGDGGNVMAVGDDAQSIYAFRGANVQNILNFPDLFPGCTMVKLEENYRSIQPVLDLTNAILENAPDSFKKNLFTRRSGSTLPQVLKPLSDLTQATMVMNKIQELKLHYPAKEIAVLFRAGYQSYNLEVQLNKIGLPFQKYGGLKYSDAAHIKDVMSYVRLMLNPMDLPAFQRLTAHIKGVGPKTCLKIYQATQEENPATLDKALKKYPELKADLELVDSLRRQHLSPADVLEEIIEHYTPKLQAAYPDDYPRRQHGLEQLVQIAASYQDLDLLVSDLSLEDPAQNTEEKRDVITLSTVHSAKGLEWDAVLIIDLVEERFPSRHAIQNGDDYEEERRLMYVACTRAREYLGLFVPSSLYSRGGGGNEPAVPSPFVRDLASPLFEEWRENYTGGITRKQQDAPYAAKPMSLYEDAPSFTRDDMPESTPPKRPRPASGYCTHKIFGRGKVVQQVPPDKYRVNFPGFGMKVIMAAYLEME